MKRTLTTLFIFIVAQSTFGQADTEKITDSILREGKRLYRSEMASWYGTDIVMEKFKDRISSLGGYFSYDNGNQTNCIFFSKDETPKVLATVSFDSSFNTATAKVDDQQRDFSTQENEIYTMRKLALAMINSDTLFKVYQNTNLNLIPLISNGEKKVYVLTGPKSSGVVVFGNDYLLSFDEQNKLLTKKQLHKNIIPVNYNTKKDEKAVGAMHSHLPETGDFITATDICTLMLYQKFAKWKQHIVLGVNYVSIWDCEKNGLAVLSREVWDNIGK